MHNVAGDYTRFSAAYWCEVLKLAYEYGWKPLGTEMDEWINPETGELFGQIDDWSGTYFSNDLQWVTEEDSAGIANALERALKDIPDCDTYDAADEESMGCLEFFSGAEKQQIEAFIAFCRAGGFRIA